MGLGSMSQELTDIPPGVYLGAIFPSSFLGGIDGVRLNEPGADGPPAGCLSGGNFSFPLLAGGPRGVLNGSVQAAIHILKVI